MKRTTTLMLSMIACASFVNGQSIFIDEDFEGGAIPMNWSQTTNATDGGYLVGTPEDMSSDFFPIADAGTGLVAVTNDDECNCDKSEDFLVTSEIDLSGATSVYFEVDAFYYGASFQGSDESAEIIYTEDDGLTWNSIGPLTGDNTGWQHISADLSGTSTSSTVKFGFRYSDGGGWLYGLAIDNLLVYEPGDWDVGLVGMAVNRYAVAQENLVLSGTVINRGLNTVTDMEVTWTSGSETKTQTLTGLNIQPFEAYTFDHPDGFVVPATGDHSVTMTVGMLNNNADANPGDNSMTADVTGLSFLPPRKVVAEEATGTWCGWCPRGAVGLETMEATYPNSFVGIAVHNGDPMVVAEYDDNIGVGGYPSGHVDRSFLDINPSADNLNQLYQTRMATAPLASVEVNYVYEPTTREVTITVSSKFAAAIANGDYRFNAVITQDNVTGTEDGWEQTNYYAGGGNGPMGGYENLPDPVPAEDMVYNHVARDILGGYYGSPGSVPATIAVDEEFSFEYTYTIPEEHWFADYNVVGFLIDNATGEIVNADKKHIIYDATGINDVEANTGVSVYPNPTRDETTIRVELDATSEVQVQITNVLGQEVFARNYGELTGTQLIPFSARGLEQGVYMINVTIDGNRTTERVLISE